MNTEIPLLLIRGSLVRAQLRELENEGVARDRDSFFCGVAYKLHTYSGFFFFIGFSFFVMGQFVGNLIMFCAVCYSISYFATYWQGDNFIMDKIDEMILNEEYVNAFVDGMNPDDTRGVRYYGRAPVDPEVRRQLVDSIIVDTDFVEAK